jgi:hypothetical protein
LTDSRKLIRCDDFNTVGADGQSECNSLDIQSLDDLSQALLELIARKEAQDDAIDIATEEKEAKKIAALRSEIAPEKLAEKSRNQSELWSGSRRSSCTHSQPTCLFPSLPGQTTSRLTKGDLKRAWECSKRRGLAGAIAVAPMSYRKGVLNSKFLKASILAKAWNLGFSWAMEAQHGWYDFTIIFPG